MNGHHTTPAPAPSPSWKAGWAAAVQRPSEGFHKNWALEGFADQTVRQVVRVTGSGTSARIKLSHRYGSTPLEVAGATIARTDHGAAEYGGTVRRLTFGGADAVRIPAGGEVYSDAAEVSVAPFESLTVSLYFARPTGPASFHAQAYVTAYRAAGDRLAAADPTVFSETSVSWYYLAAVELADGGPARDDTVVVFGDSLTDGFASTIDGNRRYSDALAERLADRGTPRPVLNQGIGGICCWPTRRGSATGPVTASAAMCSTSRACARWWCWWASTTSASARSNCRRTGPIRIARSRRSSPDTGS